MMNPNTTDGRREDDLSSWITTEVQRLLARHDEVIAERNPNSPRGTLGPMAADETAAVCQPTIEDELAKLALEFVDRLVAERARCLDAVDLEAASSAAQVKRLESRPKQKMKKQQNDCARIEQWAGQIAGPTYLEAHFGIPRSTLHSWQRRNDVVALRSGSRKHVFPVAQFVDGRPAPGIRQVQSLMGGPRPAWAWLISPSPELGGRIPIDLLREDRVEEVVRAISKQ